MKVSREWALVFGVRLTPWQWRYEDGQWVYSRWLVCYIGPWKCETEFIRHLGEGDE